MSDRIVSRTDLPKIADAVEVLYRTVESPPTYPWTPPDWLLALHRQTSAGEESLKEMQNPLHSWLIHWAAVGVLNLLTPPLYHTKPDYPELVNSQLDNREKNALIKLRRLFLDPFFPEELADNGARRLEFLTFLEDDVLATIQPTKRIEKRTDLRNVDFEMMELNLVIWKEATWLRGNAPDLNSGILVPRMPTQDCFKEYFENYDVQEQAGMSKGLRKEYLRFTQTMAGKLGINVPTTDLDGLSDLACAGEFTDLREKIFRHFKGTDSQAEAETSVVDAGQRTTKRTHRKKVPKNPNVLRLHNRLQEARYADSSLIDNAREIADGDERAAQNLVRSYRRWQDRLSGQ